MCDGVGSECGDCVGVPGSWFNVVYFYSPLSVIWSTVLFVRGLLALSVEMCVDTAGCNIDMYVDTVSSSDPLCLFHETLSFVLCRPLVDEVSCVIVHEKSSLLSAVCTCEVALERCDVGHFGVLDILCVSS